MNDTTIGLDRIEEEILAYEVSDEAVERAAETGKHRAVNATLAFCSGLDTCPA